MNTVEKKGEFCGRKKTQWKCVYVALEDWNNWPTSGTSETP